MCLHIVRKQTNVLQKFNMGLEQKIQFRLYKIYVEKNIEKNGVVLKLTV